ncbi:MAG: MATE family efflux transporter [Prevotella sp.]|nr:MATE family efflux transporter [Prevotella sp.]
MNIIRLTERDHQILRIAIPSIVSNITVPLLGLVDVAITGHLGSAAYIGAIAVGGMLFNVMYWLFAFLRMGTSGLTSQALGQRDLTQCATLLRRSLLIAFAIGACMLLLQVPILKLGLLIMAPTDDVSQLTSVYFKICIWGAPASLGLFALNGWFIGMQNSRSPMVVAIVQNVVNIAASLFLVYVLGMKVEGVATGTLIAQWCGFLMAGILCWHYYGRIAKRAIRKTKSSESSSTSRKGTARALWSVNRDIFLRTLCLVCVLMFFTSAGSRQGEVVLAVNTLLMQLYLLVSYVMDGFANAAEAMSGKYWGARNMGAFRQTIVHCFVWGAVCTAAFTLLYVIGGEPFLRLLTDEPSVVSASRSYVVWAWLVPVCSLAAFIWDGVFIGITASRQMLLSSFIAAIIFFSVYAIAIGPWGNHGLWLAFLCYMVARGAVQTFLFRHIDHPQ